MQLVFKMGIFRVNRQKRMVKIAERKSGLSFDRNEMNE